MPKVELNNVEIYYEVKGKGTEVIALLNGVAMSTDSWIMQSAEFSKNYQVLLHDFRGQGKSSLKPMDFTFEQHARDLKDLIDILGIAKLHIVGVSYGAEVGMYFAVMYPEHVSSLTLGTAVSESKPLLKGMIESWIYAARTYQGELFFKVMAPLVYSATFYELKKEWLDHRAEIFGKTVTTDWFDAFIGLCENFLALDFTERLAEIRVPTLILAGAEDLLKPVCYSELLYQKILGAKLEVIENAGHAVFLEKSAEFNQAVMGFVTGLNS